MRYQRKTRDEYCVECYYVESQGWEEVYSSEDRADARTIMKGYLKEDKQARSVRLVKRRVTIEQEGE
jgi:hypothetical protein